MQSQRVEIRTPQVMHNERIYDTAVRDPSYIQSPVPHGIIRCDTRRIYDDTR